jgi:hypothetical protein
MAGRASQSIVDDDFLATENVYEERDVGGSRLCVTCSRSLQKEETLYTYTCNICIRRRSTTNLVIICIITLL